MTIRKKANLALLISLLVVIGLLFFETKAESYRSSYVPLPSIEFTPIVHPSMVLDDMDILENSSKPSLNPPQTPRVIQQTPKPVKKEIPTTSGQFKYDPEVSWYGPGFYGKRTACGLAFTKSILGVAHRTLPCGTKVTFKWKDIVITVPVIDRGPYVAGRQWDLSGGLCVYLHHCFTGPIWYHIN